MSTPGGHTIRFTNDYCPGDTFGLALRVAGGGSLRINGVESVWKPLSELPIVVQPPPLAGETSAPVAP